MRQLLNTTTWVEPLGDPVDLAVDMCGTDREGLLRFILGNVADLHHQATHHELAAMSTALTWAYWFLDIPLNGQVHPMVWVESMPLVRWLRANTGHNYTG